MEVFNQISFLPDIKMCLLDIVNTYSNIPKQEIHSIISYSATNSGLPNVLNCKLETLVNAIAEHNYF